MGAPPIGGSEFVEGDIVSNTKKQEQPELTRAHADGGGSALFSVLAAVAYLGIFGGIICCAAAILINISESDGQEDYTLLAQGIIAAAASGCLAVLFALLGRKARSSDVRKREQLLKSLPRVEGKIVGITKYVRTIKQGSAVYHDAEWSFKIEYTDTQGKRHTAESERYVDDVQDMLKSDRVYVYLKDDGIELDGYELRKSDDDPAAELKVSEVADDEVTLFCYGEKTAR